MKKVLLFFSFFASLVFLEKANAQSCSVAHPTVSNITVNSGVGNCSVTFDLTFDIGQNNGNKWKAIYIWDATTYNSIPSNFYGANGLKVPSTSVINGSNALATIAINSNTSATTTLSSYPGDVTNPTTFQSSLTYESSGTSLTIRGITVTAPNCNGSISLKADVGASNANSFSQFGCLSRGELAFTANEPIIRLQNIGCGSTRQVAATFITTVQRSIYFKIFKDVAPFGQFTAADTAAANMVGGPFTTSTTFNSGNNDYRSIGSYNYNVNPGERFDVWVVAYTEGVANVGVGLATNSCSPLPVNFKSFTASKVNITNTLKWTTSFESNSKGFYVQRFYAGKWENVNFIASKAENGFSNSDLNYSFNDVFSFKGAVQYRIQQVDFDGTTKYSQIVSLANATVGNVLIYPNPGVANGVISIVMPDANSTYGIQILDNTGRMIKEFTSVRNTQQVSSLTRGQYLARIKDENGQVMVQKFIVQ